MTKIKNCLRMLLHMTITGLITYVVYIGPSALLRAAIHDVSEEMTFGRSVLYLVMVLALQLLYCVILGLFRYNASGEGIERLTEDCKAEPYEGVWKDMKKLIAKEKGVLLIGVLLTIFSTMQFFIPVGLSVTTFFVGITGVSMMVPEVLLWLLVPDPTAPNMGAVMFSYFAGMIVGIVSFCGLHLFLVTMKRKKWYKEWKV